ncbi:hypothetical protein ADK60_01195 [Streptomyces sp. XY431]|nr:hypothetical protein ADK60_01195 [Streptomyces sp. XY431]
MASERRSTRSVGDDVDGGSGRRVGDVLAQVQQEGDAEHAGGVDHSRHTVGGAGLGHAAPASTG